MNKNFLPTAKNASLVLGRTRTYIKLYYFNTKGELIYKKPTFGLNREHDLRVRRNRGEALVRKINFWIESGFDFEKFNEYYCDELMKKKEKDPYQINIVDAIELARDTKTGLSNKRASWRTYKNHAKAFIDYLTEKKLTELQLCDFTSIEARNYSNYWVIELGVRNNNSYNNKVININNFFNWLVKEEYLEKNPFVNIKKKRKTKAIKDNFTQFEMIALGHEIKQYNEWLWVATQLAFWAGIRQEEMTLLKFRHFDLKNWTLHIDNSIQKKDRNDTITLPIFLRKEFEELGFFKQPRDYYLFAKNIRPGKVRLSERTLNDRHRTPLNRLIRRNEFSMRKGISFQSWRRTGIEYFSNILPPNKLKDHFRHEDLATTENYLPTARIMPEVSAMVRF